MQAPVLLRLVFRKGQGCWQVGRQVFSAASPFEGPDQLPKVSNDSPSTLNNQNITSLHLPASPVVCMLARLTR
jgi:hypothetical protein